MGQARQVCVSLLSLCCLPVCLFACMAKQPSGEKAAHKTAKLCLDQLSSNPLENTCISQIHPFNMGLLKCLSCFLLSSHPLQCQLTKASPELQKIVPEVISVKQS